ncbi:hypothetical protein C0580_05060 [Candidatus Parcubacteria bacterium]|nr:MAG: hypothetical protein C0580_05060 [Candidatus Parcubacteria bacterium]
MGLVLLVLCTLAEALVQLLVDLLDGLALVDQVAPVELPGSVVARLEHPDGCSGEADLQVVPQDDLEDDDEADVADDRREKADHLAGDLDGGIHAWTSVGRGRVTCGFEVSNYRSFVRFLTSLSGFVKPLLVCLLLCLSLLSIYVVFGF